MNREQLEHVLRAAAAIAQENSLVVVGSQAVLLPYPNAPEALLGSREVDLYPALHPERADLIDGAIGAMSSFDETFGYYADGVGPETAIMPADWMDRARLYYIGDVTAICPDIHDLAVSKCAAARVTLPPRGLRGASIGDRRGGGAARRWCPDLALGPCARGRATRTPILFESF